MIVFFLFFVKLAHPIPLIIWPTTKRYEMCEGICNNLFPNFVLIGAWGVSIAFPISK